MHLIFRCDSLLNSHRMDYKYTQFNKKTHELKFLSNSRKFDENIIKNTTLKLFQPPPHSRGIIARSCAYFMLLYPEYNEYFNFIIDKELIIKWNELTPINDYEYNKNINIYDIQKNINPFIENPDILHDFIYSIK